MGVAFHGAASASASALTRDSNALILVPGQWFRTLFYNLIEFAFHYAVGCKKACEEETMMIFFSSPRLS